MLTVEKLKAQEALSTLSEDQLTAITRLSANDENEVIANKVREIHSQYDSDIASITGVAKPANVKTYDHLKTQLTSLKEAADKAGKVGELQTKITNLETEKADLLKKIKNGSGDESLKSENERLRQQLTDKNNEINQVRSTLEEEKNGLSEQLETTKGQMVGLQVGNEIDSYLMQKGIKFKDSIPESVLGDVLAMKRRSILNDTKPDFIEKDGKQTLVFRDDKGEILWNKETGGYFTAGELFLSKIPELVDNGKVQTGTGATGSGQGGNPPSQIDLSGAKTRGQAVDMIKTHLMTVENKAVSDPDFTERMDAIATEHKVMDLPPA